MKCKYCNREIKNNGALTMHEKTCEKIGKIRDDVYDLYVNEYKSINYIKNKFNIGSQIVIGIIGKNMRSMSESAIISHKLYPDKYKHSDATKKILREKRLLWMKNNPDKTAWRMSNLSYPEQKFLDKIKILKWDKKYLIIREKSVYPYYIDFAFENEKIAVEIDGSQHELEERKEKDRKKDKLLKEKGWKIIRIPASNILFDLDNVIKKIEFFVLSDLEYEKVGVFKYDKKKYYCECGEEKSRISKTCKTCYDKKQRRVKRPSYEQLMKEIEESNFVQVGKKYGVSDNAVRKWIKNIKKQREVIP